MGDSVFLIGPSLFLQILSVTKEQFGKYTCEASNRHGSASQHMDLYESQVHIILSNIYLNVVTQYLYLVGEIVPTTTLFKKV